MNMAFENEKYAEIARRQGGELTEECLVWLGQQEQGREYLVEAIHQNGTYFEDHFDSVEELKEDFERFKQSTQEI